MRAGKIGPYRGLRYLWWVVALAAVAGCGGSGNDKTAAPPKYNVLVVTLDTTRADYLSCYGFPQKTTPNLDALAADGTRFDMGIVQAALTPVSHASILTGLLPQHHGVRVLYAASGYRLPDAVPTLATVLGEKGWHTGAVLSAFPVSEFYGFDRGFAHFDNGLGHGVDNVMTKGEDGVWGYDVAANQRRSDGTTDAALAWLKQTKDPFFLWIHYWDPHDGVLVPPAEYLDKYRPAPGASREDEMRALYTAEVDYMDAQFGRVLDELKKSKRYDNTIIVVLGDHGEGLGDHNHWHHRILYQEQIRVPYIVRLPDGPRNQVIGDLVREMDIYPTVLEALGVASPAPVDGLSLRPLLQGQSDLPRMAYADALILYDLNAQRLLARRPLDDLLHCMMSREWKLIFRPRHPQQSELFHLTDDPHEARNVFSEHADQARRLLTALEALDPFVDKPFGEGIDPQVLDRLRSLGYVGDDDGGS
ncbi:MAG: sulfatase [Phycisphaerae bacterium]